MNKSYLLIISSIIIAATAVVILLSKALNSEDRLTNIESDEGYAGSRSCRECHELFYELWSPSHHGRAMQPMADVLQNGELQLQKEAMQVGDKWYEVSIEEQKLFMHEKERPDAQEVVNIY